MHLYNRAPRLAALFAACLATLPLAAAETETTISPHDFGEMAEGYTLYFDQRGRPYGVEQFLPGQRTIWAFEGDECLEGEWFAIGDAICFEYDGHPGTHCWTIHDRAGQLRIRALGAMPEDDLTLSRRSEEPMFCPGPNVGA